VKKVFFRGLVGLSFLVSLSSIAQGEEVGVGIRVILASHQEKGVDASLQDIQKKLGTLFNYSSYRLLQEHSFLLAEGQTDQLPLSGNKDLRIKLLQEQGGTAEIEVQILQGGKETFKTTVKLKEGGTLLIGGPQHEEGVLILAISAQGP
jgi:hypothetical protein